MSMPKRVILVQCGSFNPPHVFHLRNFELAKDYCAENGVEVVASVMSPAGDSYRAKHSLPFRTRVELCKLAAEHTDVTVDDWEGSQPTFVRTLDVLQHYYEQYHAGAVPVLICGSDLVDGFLIPNFWVKEKVIEMLQRFYIFCIERDIDVDRWKGSYFEQYLSSLKVIHQPVVNNVSSTLIRDLLAHNKSVKYLLSDSEIAYIRQHELYK